MMNSTTARGSRTTVVLAGCGMSLLLLATGCKSTSAALKNPSIRACDATTWTSRSLPALRRKAGGARTARLVRSRALTVQADRNSAGTLEGLKVEGSGFTPNASAHLTALMAVSGSTAAPYVEQDVQADASGKFTFEQRPLKCPQPADYGHGSWTSITARDTTSGISASKALIPGAKPDCGS